MDRLGPEGNGGTGHNGAHDAPAEREARAREVIAVTPIPKLDHGGQPRGEESSFTPLARIPRVDAAECVGCNLCYLVCPVPGCITMEQIDAGRPSESWEQLTLARGNSPVTGGDCD